MRVLLNLKDCDSTSQKHGSFCWKSPLAQSMKKAIIRYKNKGEKKTQTLIQIQNLQIR